MTTYWKSGDKYWCEDCKKFITDNKASRKHHETGASHLANRTRRLNEMRQKDLESKKEMAEVDREVLRVKREAFHAHYQDLSILKDTPTVSAQYSTYQPVESPYGYGNTDTLSYYKSGAATGKPALGGNASHHDGDWSYFDEEMLQAQRKRLYGDAVVDLNAFNQIGVAPTATQSSKEDKAPEGEGEEGEEREKKESKEDNEENDQEPPAAAAAPAKPKKIVFVDSITRETAGIPGEYREVDPSTLYNQYYTLANQEEDEEVEEEGEGGELSHNPFLYVAGQSENNLRRSRSDTELTGNEEPPEKKIRKEDSYFIDEEGVTSYYYNNNKEVFFKEKVPEKTLAQQQQQQQVLEEEEERVVVFRKPKTNCGRRGRRKH